MFKWVSKFKFCSSNKKKIFDKNVYKTNKDFSAMYRENPGFNICHSFIYDINLMNLINTMFLVKRDFERIVFIGPNPEVFLEKMPPSKYAVNLNRKT